MEADTGGQPDLDCRALGPHRAVVEEIRKAAVAILDRLMKDAIGAGGRQAVLVPAAQRRGIAEDEALEEGSLPGDSAKHAGGDERVAAACELVMGPPEMLGVRVVAVERSAGLGPLVTRIDVVACR